MRVVEGRIRFRGFETWYRDVGPESGMPLPSEPVLFFKSTTALAGPNDDVVMPRGATKVDWEVELAVIIGTQANRDSLAQTAAMCRERGADVVEVLGDVASPDDTEAMVRQGLDH